MEKTNIQSSNLTPTYYTVGFSSPSFTMHIRKRAEVDNQNWKWLNFDSGILFPVRDNAVQMSEDQYRKVMEIIAVELRHFLKEGFNPFTDDVMHFDIDDAPVKNIKIENVDELIPMVSATIGDMEVNAVDAQLLHDFLGVKDRFDQWITRRIKKYDFQINSDFCTKLCRKNSAETRGRKATDYFLTLDMAKELCMVENNKKGRQARRYFIACEKKLKDIEGRISGEFFPVKASALVRERDEAIKTKMHISDKKTATALGKVGNMSRKIKSQAMEIKDLKQKLRTEQSQKAQVSAALESAKALLEDLTPMFRQ